MRRRRGRRRGRDEGDDDDDDVDKEYGEETTLVGRPGFKPGGWRHALLGGFDSLSSPPQAFAWLARGEGAIVVIRGFLFPGELHYLVEHQVWVRVEEEGVGRVGITSLGIHLAGGEIYMCRPKTVGSVVGQGGSIAVVELAKAIVSVKSPVAGTVVEVNARLAAAPELVHSDPYGEGWLARLSLADFAADAVGLVCGEAAVRPAMEHHAWLEQIGE